MPISRKLSPLSDGTLFCVFRTVSGYAGCTYSTDDGKTWEKSDFLRYPDGRPVKHVRAANFVWKCGNDRYLYWFHNNSGRLWDGINPAWVLAGHEIDTYKGKRLSWSQPEIFLYDPDVSHGISYPDMLIYNGRYFVSETQKSVTRLHEIPTAFLESLWEGHSLQSETCKLLPSPAPMPSEASRTGLWNSERLTLVLDAELCGIPGRTVLLNTADGKPGASGLRIETNESGAVCVVFGSGEEAERMVLQREYLLGGRRQFAVTIDRAADILYASSDGVFLDGGSELRYGWKHFDGGIPAIEVSNIVLNGEYVHSVTMLC